VFATSAVSVNADAVGAGDVGVEGVEGDDELAVAAEYAPCVPPPPQADNVSTLVLIAMNTYERILFMSHLLQLRIERADASRAA